MKLRHLLNIGPAAAIFLLPLAGAAERLLHPAPWIGFLAACVIMLSQPPLDPKEMLSATAADRRSALMIYVAMIVPQLVAIFDYGYRSETPYPLTHPALITGTFLIFGGLFLLGSLVNPDARPLLYTDGACPGRAVGRHGGALSIHSASVMYRRPGSSFRHSRSSTSIWGVACIAVVTVPVYLYRIKVEESMLVQALGQAYADYRTRTRKLIPYLY